MIIIVYDDWHNNDNDVYNDWNNNDNDYTGCPSTPSPCPFVMIMPFLIMMIVMIMAL